jgi:hypothetical protein
VLQWVLQSRLWVSTHRGITRGRLKREVAGTVISTLMGFNINVCLFFSGVGTISILFFLLVRGRLPRYLSCSFSLINPIVLATGYHRANIHRRNEPKHSDRRHNGHRASLPCSWSYGADLWPCSGSDGDTSHSVWINHLCFSSSRLTRSSHVGLCITSWCTVAGDTHFGFDIHLLVIIPTCDSKRCYFLRSIRHLFVVSM